MSQSKENKAFTDVERIGNEFARILKTWLSAEEWKEMRLLNSLEPAGSMTCHSHDHCDANMAMLEAFENMGMKSWVDIDVDTPEHDAALATWNEAWNYAVAKHLTK